MASKDKRVLTIDEQKIFLNTAKHYSGYNQFAFILQTGLRFGEMCGLKWDDIDFENRILHVRRTLHYLCSPTRWVFGPPKSAAGIRDIPLTEEAIAILKNQKAFLELGPIIPEEFSDLVFVGRNGTPSPNSAYHATLKRICQAANIADISMHTLRHTFATRCIEAGMRPKTLQAILGHSTIGVTMDLYVHVTEDARKVELKGVEDALKLV